MAILLVIPIGMAIIYPIFFGFFGFILGFGIMAFLSTIPIIEDFISNGAKRYPRCDLWWGQNDSGHWLEVKTLRLHNKTKGLKKDYKERIEKDLDRVELIKPPPQYTFHHLLIIFDDKKYNNGNWEEDVYSLYNDHGMNKEDKWTIELDERRILNIFLHFKTKNALK